MYKYFVLFFFCISFSFAQNTPPILLTPENAQTVDNLSPQFDWTDAEGAAGYILQVSESPAFSNYDQYITYNSQYEIPYLLEPQVTHYWRVRILYTNVYSETRIFNTPLVDPSTYIDFIKGVIQKINETQGITNVQKNILYNFLDQAESFILNNKYAQALNKINAMTNHTQALMNGNQISHMNGNKINRKAQILKGMIQGGNTPFAENNNTAANYSLSQNYPNPFNPETYIEYYIPANTNVSVKIYNSLGMEITELVNKAQESGSYIVKWNAVNNPSGIYYYVLKTDNYSETRKMLLIK